MIAAELLMKEATQQQIDRLDLLAAKYNCDIFMPPFINSLNIFFKIDDVNDIGLMLIDIKEIGLNFRFVKHNSINFLEITSS